MTEVIILKLQTQFFLDFFSVFIYLYTLKLTSI